MKTRVADLIEWPAGDTAARVLGASQIPRGPIAMSFLVGLETLYSSVIAARNAAFDAGVKKSFKADIPVVSVGNIVAGGSGKTPFTRWLVAELTARGKHPAIIHGGYAPDEPELHRQWHSGVQVIEKRDRVAAVDEAARGGADVAVLDDAFQHRRLQRDLDIVLVPAESGSMHLLPRGPLREPASNLKRADVVVVTRKTASTEDAHRLAEDLRRNSAKPVAVASIAPKGLRNLAGKSTNLREAFVVTAIARPDLLVEQLLSIGLNVSRAFAYPDHFDYRERDVRHILEAAGDGAIVTTEKDAVKLQHLLPADRIWVLEQKLEFEEGKEAFLALFERVL